MVTFIIWVLVVATVAAFLLTLLKKWGVIASKFTATTFLLRCSIAAFAYHGGRGSFCPSCLLYAPGTRHCYWSRFVQQS